MQGCGHARALRRRSFSRCLIGGAHIPTLALSSALQPIPPLTAIGRWRVWGSKAIVWGRRFSQLLCIALHSTKCDNERKRCSRDFGSAFHDAVTLYFNTPLIGL